MPYTSEAVTRRSLEAQRSLMPAALALFAVGLPIFVWIGAYAADAPWMAASLAVLAINCASFYGVVGALQRRPDLATGARLRVHILASLLWSAAAMQIAAFAAGAGPAREPLTLLACAAAGLCLFFLSPSLPALLIAGPAAAAGPLAAFFLAPGGRRIAFFAWGAFALAFLLMLILNRAFRAQFALAQKAQELADEQAMALSRFERLAASKSALVETLSREIRDGLVGLVPLVGPPAGGRGSARAAAALAAVRELTETLEATIDSENAEAGTLAIAAAPFDIVSLVHGATQTWRPRASERGLEFALYVDPALAPEANGAVGAALADPGRVSQIVGHLLANAVRYTVRGRIEARLERRGERTLALSVVDTGPGLTPEELERAFEPFGRVERTHLGADGAGLGLSLARALAGLMGGAIEARSAPGVGSAFTLTLPFDPAAQVEPGAETRGREIGLRVLTIEPEPLAAAVLRQRFEELGHAALHARTLGRAAELIGAGGVDVLVVAAGVIESAGDAAALAGLRAAAPAAPLILLTDGEATDHRLADGAAAVLRRPVTLAALARALARAERAPHPAAA